MVRMQSLRHTVAGNCLQWLLKQGSNFVENLQLTEEEMDLRTLLQGEPAEFLTYG